MHHHHNQSYKYNHHLQKFPCVSLFFSFSFLFYSFKEHLTWNLPSLFFMCLRGFPFSFFYKKFYLFSIEEYLLYNIVSVSAIHQQKSAIDIHMSLLSWSSLPPPTPSHPSRLSQSTSLSSLSHTANSHWRSILHMLIYVSVLLSPFVPPFPPLLSCPPCPQICSLCLCLHGCPANRFISIVLLDSIYMY